MRISVVVTVVDGGSQLRSCLAALAQQQGGPELEILVPVDASVPDIPPLSREFPGVHFPAMGEVPTLHPLGSPAGQHELFDRRRAAGLAAATGEVITLLEDRGLPRPDWARRLAELHQEGAREVIGGSIGWRGRGSLSWTVYAADFGRFEPDQPAGPRDYLSDCNVSYTRRCLELVRTSWEGVYHETRVHDRLRAEGIPLWFDPTPVVEEARKGLRLGPLLRERFAWGRLYAAVRCAHAPRTERWLRGAGCLVLPLVLGARIAGRFRGRVPGGLGRAAPALLLLLGAWSAGECVGYLTGER